MAPKKEKNKYLNQAQVKIPIVIVIASVFIIHLFFSFVLIPIQVKSSSMQPNVASGKRLIYSSVGMPNSFLPFSRNIARGKLVVLRPPYQSELSPFLKWINTFVRLLSLNFIDLEHMSSLGSNPYMLRRVIAVPGDTVRMTVHTAQVKPRGSNYFTSEFELIPRHYEVDVQNEQTRNWLGNLPFQGNLEELTLRDNEYFVLSDKRSFGNDSSYWGPLPIDNILGQVLFFYGLSGKAKDEKSAQ